MIVGRRALRDGRQGALIHVANLSVVQGSLVQTPNKFRLERDTPSVKLDTDKLRLHVQYGTSR